MKLSKTTAVSVAVLLAIGIQFLLFKSGKITWAELKEGAMTACGIGTIFIGWLSQDDNKPKP